MSQILRISAVALALIVSSPVLAQEAVTQPVDATQDDDFDWGWLGLLGLIGLAGLRGRRDHVSTTTPR